MTISPKGMSVQEAYRLYRDSLLLVNRRYQRKLVWTVDEKARLIDSILRGYPIPLILLAEHADDVTSGKFEIIDGMQRLNAIFTFIENAFALNGEFFDVREFARAKQLAEKGLFQRADDGKPMLSPSKCADLLDYQLAVTIYPTNVPAEITEVFGRINANGKQLSAQERRQAGVTTTFSHLVREIASELRGDVSPDVLDLLKMPEISIDSKKERMYYGVRAEDTLWCKQGILSIAQLRDSEDEQMIADLLVSIVHKKPFPASQEALDDLYDDASQAAIDLDAAVSAYGTKRLSEHLKGTFSVLKETIETFNSEPLALRSVVQPTGGSPIKTPFYAIFMAFFEMIVKEEKSPEDATKIMSALKGLAPKLKISRHYATTEDRVNNINLTKGLVQNYFVNKEPPVLGHGPGLILDFENSVRRSRIETPRYEFKQGLLRLSDDRKFDEGVVDTIVRTLCGIANLGPKSSGYLFLGVADKESDAKRIEVVDKIALLKLSDFFVVGVDREARQEKVSLDDYVKMIAMKIKATALTDPLKTQVLSSLDTIDYHGRSVVRLVVPGQDRLSFVGPKAYLRSAAATVELEGQALIAQSKLFPK